MKSRSNACLTASLPSIANQTNLGRQLTVRCIEKQGPPVGTTQTANSLLHDSPLSPTNSVLLDSSTSYSAFQQMMRERPKSAAPYVKSLLPVPIMTSKSPLPMPKITGSLNNSSFSSLPVQQNSPSSNITTPFLLDIAPPVQEESLNDFQTQTNDIFSSWDLNHKNLLQLVREFLQITLKCKILFFLMTSITIFLELTMKKGLTLHKRLS